MRLLFNTTIDTIIDHIGKQSIILHGDSSIPLYEIAKYTINEVNISSIDISYRSNRIQEQLEIANETPSIFGQSVAIFPDIQMLNIVECDICKILLDICKGNGLLSKNCIILTTNLTYRKLKPCIKYCKVINVKSPDVLSLANFLNISPRLVVQYNSNFYRLEQLSRAISIQGETIVGQIKSNQVTNMKYIYGICEDILNNDNITYDQLLGYYDQYRPLLVWMIHENYPFIRKHLPLYQLCIISLVFTMIENSELYIDENIIRSFYLIMAGIIVPILLGKENQNYNIQFTKLMTIKSNNARNMDMT